MTLIIALETLHFVRKVISFRFLTRVSLVSSNVLPTNFTLNRVVSYIFRELAFRGIYLLRKIRYILCVITKMHFPEYFTFLLPKKSKNVVLQAKCINVVRQCEKVVIKVIKNAPCSGRPVEANRKANRRTTNRKIAMRLNFLEFDCT